MFEKMSVPQPEPTTIKDEFVLGMGNTELCRLCLQSRIDVINTLKNETLVLKIQECVSIKVRL